MNTFITKVINNISLLFLASLLFSFVLILMRLHEAYFLDTNLYYQFDAYNMLSKSSFIDLKTSMVFSIILIPIAFLVKNIRNYALGGFSLLMILSAVLQKYFLTNFELLGNNTFTFTPEEIVHILKIEANSYSLSDYFILIFYPVLFILLFLFVFYKMKWKLNNKAILFGASLYAIFLTSSAIEYKHYLPKAANFNTYHQYEMGNNKLTYFISDFISSKLNDEAPKDKKKVHKDVGNFVRNYHARNDEFDYIDDKYPLMHNTPYKNSIGPFFKMDSLVKPNVVILMIESLSRSFSGPNPHLGSFTPFLDSLKNESLYWENFLSNADRTYGVLPHSLSSSPFFTPFVSCKPYVNHTSIIEELKKENYSSSFSCGVWSNFNSMSDYLNNNKIDFVFGDQNFDTSLFKKHIAKEKDFHWGFDDGALLQQHMLRKEVFNEPYLSVLLTISMHPPYDVDHDYSLGDAVEYLGETTEFQKKLIDKHPKKLRSIIYVDEQLKLFFETYKKRPDYKNTIFMVYGDHNIHSLPEKNRLDGFHVPLIIHSDLITRTASFKGVCTHRDITPSILGLLEGNFNMKFSKEKHWLNSGFDTSRNFRADVITPMVLHSNLLINYIYKDQVIVGNKEVYVMDSLFNLTLQSDQDKADEMLKHYEEYMIIERYMMHGDKVFK